MTKNITSVAHVRICDSNSQANTDTFSSPEAALLLVSTKNRDLWPGPTPEVRDWRTSRHSAHVQSQVWQIWLVLVSIYCVFKAIQKRNVVGLGQRSRFLVLTKRSAASGDENDTDTEGQICWKFNSNKGQEIISGGPPKAASDVLRSFQRLLRTDFFFNYG